MVSGGLRLRRPTTKQILTLLIQNYEGGVSKIIGNTSNSYNTPLQEYKPATPQMQDQRLLDRPSYLLREALGCLWQTAKTVSALPVYSSLEFQIKSSPLDCQHKEWSQIKHTV